MEPINKTLQEIMAKNPEFKKRMQDVQNYYAENPIQQINEPSDKCPFHLCDGSGFIWWKDWSRATQPYDSKNPSEWQELCKCYEQRKKALELKKKLATAGIPKLFVDAHLNNFNYGVYKTEINKQIGKTNRTAAINYIKNFEQMSGAGKGLYIYSSIKGSGKTRLAISIANDLVHQLGINVTVVKAVNMSKEVRKTYKQDSNMNDLEVIAAFQKADVLVIDDLAAEKPSEFVEELLYTIFDYRVEQKLPTIITSNLTIEEFGSQQYRAKDGQIKSYEEGGDSRVVSRLKKLCMEIFMPEESVRDRESEYENNKLEQLLFKEAK
ncbi:ATP-binding protein [Rummeliibacillus sp. JY-2-4R]